MAGLISDKEKDDFLSHGVGRVGLQAIGSPKWWASERMKVWSAP